MTSDGQEEDDFWGKIDEQCTVYMSFGMSYSDFWDGEPSMKPIYRKLHTLQRKQRNEELWLQGAYFYNAMSVIMANAFAKKGAKKEEYPSKPYDITPKTEQEEIADTRARVIKSLNNLARLKKE